MAAQANRPALLTLYGVYASLLLLLVLTAVGAKMPLSGRVHDVMAYGISILKTILIVLIFMEVKYSKGIMRIFASAGLVWLFLLFLLTFCDYVTREWRF